MKCGRMGRERHSRQREKANTRQESIKMDIRVMNSRTVSCTGNE